MAFAAFAIEPSEGKFEPASAEGGEWWRQKNQLDKIENQSTNEARVEQAHN